MLEKILWCDIIHGKDTNFTIQENIQMTLRLLHDKFLQYYGIRDFTMMIRVQILKSLTDNWWRIIWSTKLAMKARPHITLWLSLLSLPSAKPSIR